MEAESVKERQFWHTAITSGCRMERRVSFQLLIGSINSAFSLPFSFLFFFFQEVILIPILELSQLQWNLQSLS